MTPAAASVDICGDGARSVATAATADLNGRCTRGHRHPIQRIPDAGVGAIVAEGLRVRASSGFERVAAERLQ